VRSFWYDNADRSVPESKQPRSLGGEVMSSAATVCASGEVPARSHTDHGERVASYGKASARQEVVHDFFHSHDLTVEVPLPAVTDAECIRRSLFGQEPFYRPSSAVVDDRQFMVAMGYGYHPTVSDEQYRNNIIWEPTPTGYWFWGDAMDVCPRAGVPWVELTEMVILPALEEYAVAWCMYQHEHREHGERFDSQSWSWLRTRTRQDGALRASGSCVLHINVCDTDALRRVYPGIGGRSVERIAAAR